MLDAYINPLKAHPVLAGGILVFFICLFIVTEISRRAERKRKAQEAATKTEARTAS
jgi:hypothetical protein